MADIAPKKSRVNASIADRYYGAASATPARVFGALMRSARTHISDARKRNRGLWIEARMQEIVDRLGANLPRTLRLEDSAVRIGVMPWVKAADYGDAVDAVNLAVLAAFRERGVIIAPPQREVRLLRGSGRRD